MFVYYSLSVTSYLFSVLIAIQIIEEVKKPSFKYCMVPKCKNTITSTPDKEFFRIPRDAKEPTKKWCKMMRRHNVSPLSVVFCCEYNYNPGRVVTLIKSQDHSSEVWGVAYKIKHEDIEHVSNHLDFREKNGYTKKLVTFYPKDASLEPFQLTIYIATEDNESYAGPASIDELAKQIIECKGPSGTNKEYVYCLAKAMRELAPDMLDDHLYELEKQLKKLDQENKPCE